MHKVLDGKEVNVGYFSDPEEARDVVRHAMRLYDEHFERTGQASGTKIQ